MLHTIYQAGPLFSQAERQWHTKLTLKLEKAGHIVIWPGSLLPPEAIEEAGALAVQQIFSTCRSVIDNCNCVVALLDGPQVDDGTAWETGYAYAKGIPVYGIRTDSRVAGDTPFNRMNSMIEGCLSGLATSMDELVRMLETA